MESEEFLENWFTIRPSDLERFGNYTLLEFVQVIACREQNYIDSLRDESDGEFPNQSINQSINQSTFLNY